jgi:hypothetical protein
VHPEIRFYIAIDIGVGHTSFLTFLYNIDFINQLISIT